jgi:prolyl 4-hydroxylase
MLHEIVIPGYGRPFVEGDSLDHGAPLVFTVPDVLTGPECTRMIERIERLGPAPAPVTTARGFVMRPDIRNNQRVMFDDHELARLLYTRIERVLPPTLFGMATVGVNERFRCYRYAAIERFAPHLDGAFMRNARERSQLTLMVYLNEGFEGGNTRFLDWEREVVPRTGHALLFQHQLWHEGCVVKSGIKYVLRSDVMYRR